MQKSMLKQPQIQNLVVYKYCANGNDFLIFHTFAKGDFSALAKRLCNRFLGIGADGLVVVKPHLQQESNSANVSYQWDFYNSDGSKASMCGNASRCVGHYAHALGLAKDRHSFLSQAGIIGVEVDGDIVQSNLGKFHSLKKLGKLKDILSLRDITQYMEETISAQSVSSVSTKALLESKDSSLDLALKWALGGLSDSLNTDLDCKDTSETSSSLEILKNAEWFYLDTGVPHIVCFVSSQNLLPSVAQNTQNNKDSLNKPFLPILRKKFNANVTMAHKIDEKRVAFATYERGVEGITQSCGSGAAAALVVGYRFFGVESKALLIPPSGEPTQVSEDSNGCVYLREEVKFIAVCYVSPSMLTT